MSESSGSLSPTAQLDNALAELRSMSNRTGFCSSSSSPFTSASSGVASPVFTELTDSVMVEPITGKQSYSPVRADSFKYGMMAERLGSPPSTLFSEHAARKKTCRVGTELTADVNSNVIGSCTCCPHGHHQYDGYYTIRPAVSRRGNSLSRSVNINGDESRLLSGSTMSQAPVTRCHDSVDSQGSELSSPESLCSPLSSPSDRYNSRSSRNLVTKTTTTITSSNILPVTGENESLTISPEAIKQIKEHAESSNRLIRELQDQLQLIPQLQERIKALKEDKVLLAHQLKGKSGISSMRSIGVGDYDVDEDHVRVERIKQTVTKREPKPPTRGVGVGVYDINTELFTHADVLHTVEEHVQKVREKEIQSWIQEAQSAYEARKASTRSFGVGEKDIWDEENRLIKEREMRTILIEQQRKPSQRNVGLQVKPTMRDVCIEFSPQDVSPLTRTCGFNVDVGDLIQEMSIQSAEQGGLVSQQQQQQQSSWTVQKHVIQRKFMEAMMTGKQEDLVNFITGLLKRSVRSVGTTVKPSTVDYGVNTQTRSHDKGVGDDVTDVVVKPFVHTKDTFSLAKPSMRTQPTWTDLILTCDAGTNTQKCVLEKAVNTVCPPQLSTTSGYGETSTVTQTQHMPPPVATKPAQYNYQQTIIKPPSQESVRHINLYGDLNRKITETTMTEHRTTNSKPEVDRRYHTHVNKLMSPPPRRIELDITLPEELTAEEHTAVTEESLRQTRAVIGDEHHRTEVHLPLPSKQGPLQPLLVQVSPSSGGEITSSTHTLVAQHTASPDTCSLLDTSLSGRQQSAVEVHHHTDIQQRSLRSRSLSGDRLRCSVSPVKTLTPSSSFTKTVISEEKPCTTLKETTELSESGGTVKKETVIERTFTAGSSRSRSIGSTATSSSRPQHKDLMSSSLTDFDYFGTGYSALKPKGHAERMERYGDSISYSSTGANVDEERNKTELHGNPLKSRYTIEEMSTGSPPVTTNRQTASKTKSLLKDRGSPRIGRKPAVKFADQVTGKSDFSPEFHSACSILDQHLKDGGGDQSPQVLEAHNLVRSMWLDIGASRTSDPDSMASIFKYLSQQYSPILLEHVVNMADGNGNTALHYAVSNANFDVMKTLLQTGLTNANTQNKAGYTPVMLASLCEVKEASERKVLRLVLLNADVNMTALQAGQTALMLAVSHGRLEMVRLLLEARADVNLQDTDGSTALMCATEHNHMQIVEPLLAHTDIDVLLKDNDGSTALDIALENGYEEIAELLEKCEASARARLAVTERRSASRVIPSHKRRDDSHRASSCSSSRPYTSKFV